MLRPMNGKNSLPLAVRNLYFVSSPTSVVIPINVPENRYLKCRNETRINGQLLFCKRSAFYGNYGIFKNGPFLDT